MELLLSNDFLRKVFFRNIARKNQSIVMSFVANAVCNVIYLVILYLNLLWLNWLKKCGKCKFSALISSHYF